MDEAEGDEGMPNLRLPNPRSEELLFVLDFVAIVKNSKQCVDGCAIKNSRTIIAKYQEQGHLLEPYLEGLIRPLMETMQFKVAEADDVAAVDLTQVKNLCSVVHTLMTVCGYKTVVKVFPHQACDLEVAVSLLERCHREVTAISVLKEDSTGDWETQCTLLLWLSILVLIPFDMASVDTALADCGACSKKSSEAVPPIVDRIIRLCKDYLASPGPVREMAGVLLSRLLCRPDMSVALKNFVSWTREAFGTAEDATSSVFLVPGILGVLAATFKVGHRDTLLATAPAVWRLTGQLVGSPRASRSPLVRKLLIKLIHRIGLVHLLPRVTTWHYMRTGCSLIENLTSPPLECTGDIALKTSANNRQAAYVPSVNSQKSLNEDMDIPDVIEEVIEHQLNGLRDKVTVVRWSAAKGIGRVTGRLSLTMADEVVTSILALFRSTEGDGAWHGACLALAELARRGVLLPERLFEVVPVVIKALHYDVRRGHYSIGTHVRDAAAYVIWAFARTYSPELLKEHLKQIAPALLATACYDREVNCRRAAAAAFQEVVGRQGDFEYGIDIVNSADYFSLSTRSNAYRLVAVYIAQFDQYRLFMIQELLNSKVSHWEKALRELAAESLSLLAKYDPPYFEGPVLDTLLPLTLSQDIGSRHGATLAVAEIISALYCCGLQLTEEKAQAISEVVPAIEKARLYRGKGGEMMRSAVSRFIECTATARVPLSHRVQKVFLGSIDENLNHPNSDVQARAAAALKAFVRGYMIPVDAAALDRTTSKFLRTFVSYNPVAQRGAALALGALHFDLLAPVWSDMVDTLCCAADLKGNSAEEDAETRMNAVRSLTTICETVCHEGPDSGNLILAVRKKIMVTLFKALNDYAIDNRGDVGSWIREAAMEGVERWTYILYHLSGQACEVLIDEDHGFGVSTDSGIGVEVVGGLVKQAVEKIDRVRDAAGRILQRLLQSPANAVFHIPYKDELKQILGRDTTFNWGVSGIPSFFFLSLAVKGCPKSAVHTAIHVSAFLSACKPSGLKETAPEDSFPRLVKLLGFPLYRKFVISGLVISMGGLADSLGKISTSSLLDFLQGPSRGKAEDSNITDSTDTHYTDWLGGELLQVLTCYAGNDRVIVPALKTLDILFSRGIFSLSQPPGDDVAIEIVTLVAQELCKCKDVAKLLAGVFVLSHFGTLQGPSRILAVRQLLILLFHGYPKVRKLCAEQLYLLLLQVGDEVVGSDSLDRVMEMIGGTCWDGRLETIKAEQDELFSLFRVQLCGSLPKSSLRTLETQPKMSWDENDNYSALVDAAGY